MPSQKKQSTILRQWTLLRHCLSTSFKTTQDIHQALIQQGFSITERTLLRDLQQLEEAGLPIKSSDTKPINWRIDQQWQDKIGGMTEGEALMLVLAYEYLGKALPSTLTATLKDLFVQAKNMLNTHHQRNSAQWMTKMRIVDDNQPRIAPIVDEVIKEKLTKALLNNDVIQVVYIKYTFNLSPLALIVRGNILYLAAIKKDESIIKMFALHRFKSVNVLYGEYFNRPKDFDLDKLLAQGWADFHDNNTEVIELEVWCDHRLANNLYEMPLSHQQRVYWNKKSTNGRYWLKVELPYTWQLKQWILSQGSKIEVVKPVWLREALQEEIHAMLNNYQS